MGDKGASALRPPSTSEQRDPPKTQRFASATRIPPSQPNRFAAELKVFLLPLVGRFRHPDGTAATWAVGDSMLAGPLLQCLGVLLECAGPAAQDRDQAAARCVDLVEEFIAHGEPYVRRCALFLLSRVLLVGADEQVVSRDLLVDRLEPALRREGDEPCRKMLAGILRWLHQNGLNSLLFGDARG